MTAARRILIVEPYYGGSHRQFIEGLAGHIEGDFTLLTLPPRSWKQRMQTSAPWFARQVAGMAKELRRFDVVLSSTFVDGAVLKVLLQSLDGWHRDARFCVYFHENQFCYPGRNEDLGIRQFQYLNFTTALTADRLAFNSHFNHDTFMAGCRSYLQRVNRGQTGDILAQLEGKSLVLPPGLEFSLIDHTPRPETGRVPVIVWNHRWEHDKSPEKFFAALHELHLEGHGFGLIILGQSFARPPECFGRAKKELAEHILHFGFAGNRREYARLLRLGDIVVSTASHEFFGLAILEAVRAGCRPLVPNRLAYPELFPGHLLYDEGELASVLGMLLRQPTRLADDQARNFTESYSWQALAPRYADWLFGPASREGTGCQSLS